MLRSIAASCYRVGIATAPAGARFLKTPGLGLLRQQSRTKAPPAPAHGRPTGRLKPCPGLFFGHEGHRRRMIHEGIGWKGPQHAKSPASLNSGVYWRRKWLSPFNEWRLLSNVIGGGAGLAFGLLLGLDLRLVLRLLLGGSGLGLEEQALCRGAGLPIPVIAGRLSPGSPGRAHSRPSMRIHARSPRARDSSRPSRYRRNRMEPAPPRHR